MKPITVTSSNAASVSGVSHQPTAGPSPVGCVALGAIRAYKIFVSPLFRGSCRFLPSCADYAAEAIERHGVIRGTWLAARRVSRCHPLCRPGFDPVPPVKPTR